MAACVVSLSGGQDSTTALYWAKKYYDTIHTVCFYYGQRHNVEVDMAARISAMSGALTHTFLDLSGVLGVIGDSALIGTGKAIDAGGGYGDSHAPNGLPTSFVPGRNLIMLASAASLAVKYGAQVVVTGVCQTDYSGYPDCRAEFISSLEETLALAMPSSCGPIEIRAPLMHKTKAETVLLARELEGCWEALAHSVTCYNGEIPGCGKCPACELRAKGFAEAGLEDPAA